MIATSATARPRFSWRCSAVRPGVFPCLRSIWACFAVLEQSIYTESIVTLRAGAQTLSRISPLPWMHATSIQNSLRTFPDFATRNLAVLRSGVMDVCNGNRIDDDRQCDHCIARILTCATGIPSNVVKICESRLTKGFVFEKSDRCWHYFG